jgi:hypothetical protein
MEHGLEKLLVRRKTVASAKRGPEGPLNFRGDGKRNNAGLILLNGTEILVGEKERRKKGRFTGYTGLHGTEIVVEKKEKKDTADYRAYEFHGTDESIKGLNSGVGALVQNP